MCVSIKIGDKVVTTVKDLKSMGIAPVFGLDDSKNWSCLCGLDLKLTAAESGYKCIDSGQSCVYVFEKAVDEVVEKMKETNECPKVVIIDRYSGDVVAILENIKDLLDFGITPMFMDTINVETVKEDECLCDVDLQKTAEENGYECGQTDNIYTFIYNEDWYDHDEEDKLIDDGESDDLDEEDKLIDDGESDDLYDDLDYQFFQTVKHPVNEADWFVADEEGNLVCVFENGFGTKEMADAITYSKDLVRLLKGYVNKTNNDLDESVAKFVLSKFN